MKGIKTREKIIDASLGLFNEKKASNVSTVQISTAMKISPGNLYYYFANKEDLIRLIWKERMVREIRELFLQGAEKIQDEKDLLEFLKGCFDHYERYRFFYKEIDTLFVNDPKLEALYDRMAEEEKAALTVFFHRWETEGKMRGLTEEDRLLLAENFMVLSYGADMKHVLALLGFCLTEDSKEALEQEVKKER